MSSAACLHVPLDLAPPQPVSDGCQGCLASGRTDWVHLRLCQQCGHVGCCDNSVGRHVTGDFHESGHMVIRSFEPHEDWWWCFEDETLFMIPEAPPALSYRTAAREFDRGRS